jgi:hypothetical protein
VAGVAHGLVAAGVADAGAFLARLARLDPHALVRLRPAGEDRTALWARVPWEVLVTRSVPGELAQDATVLAADLLAELAREGTDLPARRDQQWRWPLPPARAHVLERVPVGAVREIGAAAAGTVRAAAHGGVGGRPVGDRVVRDALLDHVAIRVTPDLTGDAGRDAVDVPQRLVQAVIRMGFLGGAPDTGVVRVLRAGGAAGGGASGRYWVGLAAPYGTAWLRPAGGLVVHRTV